MSFPPLHPLLKCNGEDKRGTDEMQPRCPARRAPAAPQGITPFPPLPPLPLGPDCKQRRLNREHGEPPGVPPSPRQAEGLQIPKPTWQWRLSGLCLSPDAAVTRARHAACTPAPGCRARHQLWLETIVTLSSSLSYRLQAGAGSWTLPSAPKASGWFYIMNKTCNGSAGT